MIIGIEITLQLMGLPGNHITHLHRMDPVSGKLQIELLNYECDITFCKYYNTILWRDALEVIKDISLYLSDI